jgi:hypothetical protein
MPDLSEAELAAVIAALKEKLDRDRYPRAPRLEPFRAASAAPAGRAHARQRQQAIGPCPTPGSPAMMAGKATGAAGCAGSWDGGREYL